MRGWSCKPLCSPAHREALLHCSGAGPGAVGALQPPVSLQWALGSHHRAVRPPSPLHLTPVMRSWTSPGLINPPSPRNWCHGARGSRAGGRTRGHSQPLEVLQVLENPGLQLGDLVVAEEPGNEQRREMIWYRCQLTQLLLKLPRSLRAPCCQYPTDPLPSQLQCRALDQAGKHGRGRD